MYSGLKLNIEKTEGLWIGANKNEQSKPFGISWSKNADSHPGNIHVL